MPASLSKLTPEQHAEVFAAPASRIVDLTPYAESLREVAPGESAAVDLEGSTARLEKRRFNAAAKQIGVELSWKSDKEKGTLYLSVTQTSLPIVGQPEAGELVTQSPRGAGTGRSRKNGAAQAPEPAEAQELASVG